MTTDALPPLKEATAYTLEGGALHYPGDEDEAGALLVLQLVGRPVEGEDTVSTAWLMFAHELPMLVQKMLVTAAELGYGEGMHAWLTGYLSEQKP